MAAVVAVWLIFTVVAFWWFQFRDLRPFADSAAVERQVERFAAGHYQPGVITVIHFWDSDCQCSRFSNDHVAALVREYAPQGVRFVMVPRQGGVA